MMTSALAAFAHHLLLFAVITALVVELVRVRGDTTAQELKRLQIVDTVYGVAAVLLIVVGVVRVMYFEKGEDYYLNNLFFWLKIGIFVAVGVLSIYPTLRYSAWAKLPATGERLALPEIEVRRVRLIIHAELTGIALVMLCAALLAKGIG